MSLEKFSYFASQHQLEKKYGKPKLVPHFLLGFITSNNYKNGKNKHNSLGFRGDEIKQQNSSYRIVCIGASTTYSSGVKNYKESYPYILQGLLNKEDNKVEVINAGVPGYNSLQSLINFQTRILDLNPDLIIVYHGINDFFTRLVWPKSEYKADLSGMVNPKNLNDNYSFLEKSTFLRIIMLRLGFIESQNSLSKIMSFPESSHSSKLSKQVVNGDYPSGIFKEVSLKKMLDTNKPIYFERNIQSIINIAKSDNIKVLLSSFIYNNDKSKNYVVNIPESQAAIEEHNYIIEKLSKETNSYFLNLKEKFPIEKKYFTDDVHFTKEGNELRAKIISDFIINKEVLKTKY